jgi:AraC family transcriptional regulator of adaptative response/methylated-DNA-[protein]-cysteine methyltransferase
MKLHVAIGDCLLGKLLVATNEQGICAVLLGDDRDSLLSDLAERFSFAKRDEAGAPMQTLLRQIVDEVHHPRSIPQHIKLEPKGTAFQQKVWTALRQIPVGQTVTYKQLAERIGSPRAVRAVAGACAANPIAVLIPCHRVLRSDGGLSGYRWGVERKRALLARESSLSAQLKLT